ncbi:hypothetical protein KTD15_06345 [Burkholderia multivorans]|uniref:hypothetical protein n=1 Tax=Burkholderia multivorans TaxID=87883 RepID=UPI001C21D23D|nr:hypothetical protein [Burkholderia multivorans]MBU9118414.1 hypothetical protein [Burkholderia multivorans]MBU9434140.1 hypothetical protein [Burkholderia multivorans]
MTEAEAKYLSKLNQLENHIINEMVAAYIWNHVDDKNSDDYMDNFNIYYNDIDYTYTKQFTREFFSRNQALIKEFNRNWFDLNTLEKSEQPIRLLDYHLNHFAWNNFHKIVELAKENSVIAN